jgi:hypothetical protein
MERVTVERQKEWRDEERESASSACEEKYYESKVTEEAPSREQVSNKHSKTLSI